ncbi:methyltransferase domain-containing protein [Patescibacteria group bacterium]|nr:methyltransferase domain-containing protein [Patescibacteria group bacterium]MBU4458375.1 methyltransferase domain-containing protein [Patescibacteria group bacterium]MCG2695870.1 methyltransferase domain-containing protein [Candidatus Portnoybacteria bacterium]
MKEKIKKIIPNFYTKARKTYFGKNSNSLRRFSTYWYLKLKYSLFSIEEKNIKLHLGCGRQKKDGFINIDYNKTKITDYVLNVINLPFPPGSIERIECYHLIEHFSIKEIPYVFSNWYKILKPGGELVMEFPDFDKNIEAYLKEGDEKRLFNIFGAQRFLGDVHLWGWNYERIKTELEKYGFIGIKQEEPRDYHIKEEDCIRVVACKIKQKI